jgi:tetracycline 7-halogenase / FADH2 O2-dependent halogenase
MFIYDKCDFDVIIIGSGFAGAVLASLLCRHGGRVAIIDAGVHPRFAIGESTIPQTSQLLTLLAREYDVPELERIGLKSPGGLREVVGNCCGIKRIFGFAYHHLEQEHDPDEAHCFGNVWRDENHLFRQEVDAYLLRVAISYGATVLQGTKVAKLVIAESGVSITTDRETILRASYLVDATGYQSVLAKALNLRERPCRFAHHSRSIFTHMIDVAPFEECVEQRTSIPWSLGTLHHVFERGWIWVIPFNNYPESHNPLISVGLTIDPRTYPVARTEPEREFADFLQHLPSVDRQFRKARTVRPWVRTERLQYSSRAIVGHRYCLMSHASGFLDPLYSRGLINTVEVIGGLVRPLLDALADGDYGEERFAHLETLGQSVLDFADRLVNCSFIAWSNFDVWNAWLRVWAIGVGEVESRLGGALAMGALYRPEVVQKPLFSPYESAGYRPLFERAASVIEDMERGEVTAAEAARRLFDYLDSYGIDMRLPNRAHSHAWAMKHPLCRDLFVGDESLHQRWSQRIPDPHLG